MSRLQMFTDAAAPELLVDTEDGEAIAAHLEGVGVVFERWATRDLAPGASEADILAAYKPEIDRLKAQGGYQSIDALSVAPDNPNREALRAKFLSEHTHAEDEVRFFVEGKGLFTLHIGDRVFNVLCERGDLISVPAGTRHWFDTGAEPNFTVLRLFVNPDGWVATFTGDDIAQRYPRLEPVAA
ncbi:1,2-dihydroxy-3-keto-5-methylthiopentene dioxygenase [Sphingomonas sp. GlSt437]|uniref:1,2-dihydroxy-3-keto-5-methylthiopentene dioxygenase n=1 Tax=Sphingomonas sp. GlSt437 TaxID=3389970 RepID=UPI003A8C647F